MTVAEFEKRAIALMQQIPGASRTIAEVGPGLVRVTCDIEQKPHEISYVFADDDEREIAFHRILQALATDRDSRLALAEGRFDG